MRYRFLFLIFMAFIVLFSSCKRNRLNVNISDIKSEAEIIRFDKELFKVEPRSVNFKAEINQLRENYPGFFDLFTLHMIQVGSIEDSMFTSEMNRFLTDSMIIEVHNQAEAEFSKFSSLEKEIIRAFKYYQYYFPEKEIPKIYTCISGFNQSVVVAQGMIGVSLDKYLGSESEYYDMLALAQYKKQKMYKERIPVDLMYAWAKSEFIKSNKETNLLSHMIYEGKLLYFVDAMFPKMHDSIKIGYTAKQLDWCKRNESQMWTTLVEDKRLYTSKRMDIKRIIDDGPYTKGFPVESPGRAGVWIGWQIVRQFMEKHPEITLKQMFQLNDSQQILNDSKYFPE